MSHLRVIICQVDDDEAEEPVSELSRFDLPPVPVDLNAALDRIEALVARVGQCVLGRLLDGLQRDFGSFRVDTYHHHATRVLTRRVNWKIVVAAHLKQGGVIEHSYPLRVRET